MSNFKKMSLALISAGVLSLGVQGSAQATALATSVLELKNLIIYIGTAPSPGNPASVSQLGISAISSEASVSATYNNVTASKNLGPSPTGQLDIQPQCQGPGCPGITNDTFPRLNTAPTGANFIAGDQTENGSPVSGLADGNGGFVPVGANVKSAAYANLTGVSAGSNGAISNNNLLVDFGFTGTGQFLTFSFDASIYQEVMLTNDLSSPSSARTKSDFSFVIRDITNPNNSTVFYTLAPNELNQQLGSTAPFNTGDFRLTGETAGKALDYSFTATTPFLAAGRRYELLGTLTTTASATDFPTIKVPEPGMLALLGVGLLGFGLSKRRRS